MSHRNVQAVLIALLVSLFVTANSVVAVDYTWDGTGDGFTWTDPLNWNLDSGTPATNDRAFFTGAANVTAGFPVTVTNVITTGGAGQLVTLNGSLNIMPNMTDSNGLFIGAGGLTVNGNVGGANRNFESSGPVTINGTLSMIPRFPVQTAGTWDITTLALPQVNGNIGAWNFIDGANTTIGHNSIVAQQYTWTGQPTFEGGRPNWNFANGGGSGVGGRLQLGAFTLYGNVLTLDGWPADMGDPNRRTELHSNGGTLDLNAFAIAGDNPAGSFLNVDNGTILIQGTSGNVWNNNSTANTSFDVMTNTNTRIDPTGTGNTVSANFRSQDTGIGGFTDNFAFHNLTLGGGDTVNLTGSGYVSGNSALYVNGTLRGEHNATLGLVGRNVYVNGALEMGSSPGQFTITNGGVFLTSNAAMTFELNGPVAGTGYDQLVLTGAGSILHLNNAELNIVLGGASNGLFFLVDNQSVNAIDGIFNGLAEGSTLSFNGGRIIGTISYLGDAGANSFTGGNDIVLQLVAVPEPSTLLIGSLLLGIGLVRRRRGGAAK